MRVGTAQLDITPQPGIELAGFAVRPQPATGVLDALAVRGLYLEDEQERLLWLHADLLAVEESLVSEMRCRIQRELGLPASCVLISTTHTHSGPPTIHLTGCGKYDARYVHWLKERFLQAARSALSHLEFCDLVTVEGHCDLAVDRRGGASAHSDPRVAAVGWRRADGMFKAVLLNYALHGVCLCGTEISADWPGEAARVVSNALRGHPLVLVCAGACGNLNPPALDVSPEQMRDWGRQVAQSVWPALAASASLPADEAALTIDTATVPLPLERWSPSEITEYADRCLADAVGHREFGGKFPLAVETWRSSMVQRGQSEDDCCVPCEVFAVGLGQVVFVAVNAEIFSHFNELVGRGQHRPVYAFGCANGMIGYLPQAAAYDEDGYEVQRSMFFYNKLRPQRGGLEILADRSRCLIEQLPCPGSDAQSKRFDVPESVGDHGATILLSLRNSDRSNRPQSD